MALLDAWFDHPGGNRRRDVLRRDADAWDRGGEIKRLESAMVQGEDGDNKLSAGDAFIGQADGTNKLSAGDTFTGQADGTNGTV